MRSRAQGRVGLALQSYKQVMQYKYSSSTMPPIQTPPRQSRARSISSSAAQKHPSKRRNLSPDILELSNPDVHTHVPPRRRKPLTKYKLKLKAPIVNKDVIEISSDEGEVSLSQESTVANLRCQVKSLACVCLCCYFLVISLILSHPRRGTSIKGLVSRSLKSSPRSAQNLTRPSSRRHKISLRMADSSW